MPRISVYVPDHIKTGMDEARDAFNWSALAQRAFEQALLTHAVTNDHDMTEVTERLRARKEQFLKEEKEKGQSAGRGVLRSKQRFLNTLSRIKRKQNDLVLSGNREFILRKLIDPENNLTEDEWVRLLKLDPYQLSAHSYTMGFCDGAIEVLDEKKL